jgi:hypothetical protein
MFMEVLMDMYRREIKGTAMGYWRVKDGPQGFMLQGGRMQGSSGSAGISFQMFGVLQVVIFEFFSGSDAGRRFSKSDTRGISNCRLFISVIESSISSPDRSHSNLSRICVILSSGYEPGLARDSKKSVSQSVKKVKSEPPEIITTHHPPPTSLFMSSVTPNDREDGYKVELLQGSANYRTWKFSMRMVLQAKDLWEVVSGEEAKPVEEKAAQAWEKKARKALAAIALALSAAEKEHIIECTAPKAAWDILEKLYEGKGRNRKFMGIVQDVNVGVGGEDGCVFEGCEGEDVGVGGYWFKVGKRCQTRHYPQRFARSIPVPRRQFGEGGEDRFR